MSSELFILANLGSNFFGNQFTRKYQGGHLDGLGFWVIGFLDVDGFLTFGRSLTSLLVIKN